MRLLTARSRSHAAASYTNSSPVTSHSMSFNGTKGLLYEYYVTSANAGGSTTAGPFTHQN